jgi:hypothetical protein
VDCVHACRKHSGVLVPVEEDCIRTLRTGITPGRKQLIDFMPWKYFGQMTDDELKAVWLYLQSLPALSQGK